MVTCSQEVLVHARRYPERKDRTVSHRTLVDQGALAAARILDDEAGRGPSAGRVHDPAEIDRRPAQRRLQRRREPVPDPGDQTARDAIPRCGEGDVGRRPAQFGAGREDRFRPVRFRKLGTRRNRSTLMWPATRRSRGRSVAASRGGTFPGLVVARIPLRTARGLALKRRRPSGVGCDAGGRGDPGPRRGPARGCTTSGRPGRGSRAARNPTAPPGRASGPGDRYSGPYQRPHSPGRRRIGPRASLRTGRGSRGHPRWLQVQCPGREPPRGEDPRHAGRPVANGPGGDRGRRGLPGGGDRGRPTPASRGPRRTHPGAGPRTSPGATHRAARASQPPGRGGRNRAFERSGRDRDHAPAGRPCLPVGPQAIRPSCERGGPGTARDVPRPEARPARSPREGDGGGSPHRRRGPRVGRGMPAFERALRTAAGSRGDGARGDSRSSSARTMRCSTLPPCGASSSSPTSRPGSGADPFPRRTSPRPPWSSRTAGWGCPKPPPSRWVLRPTRSWSGPLPDDPAYQVVTRATEQLIVRPARTPTTALPR